MNTLLHLPLEPYKARYTEFLATWEKEAFSKKFNVEEIQSADPSVSLDIVTGSVLDQYQRPIHALGQAQTLLRKLQTAKNYDALSIYCSDMFHPGIESLGYLQDAPPFSAAAYCWAQTFDKYDFTTTMPWMRHYELMALSIFQKVFVASPILADLIETAIFPHARQMAEIVPVGLPFNSAHVFSQLEVMPGTRDYDVVFSSRFDLEKSPAFFLDLVEACPDLVFAVCTGRTDLVGTDGNSVLRAKQLQKDGKLYVLTDLTKKDYYSVLARSKVQFNCSLQDWVSFTLLEALTFGCYPVYPLFRDFAHCFAEHPEFLYAPGSVTSAAEKLYAWTDSSRTADSYERFRAKTLAYHDGTLNRIAQLL